MFTTKQSLGDKLPPTRGSLMPAIKRASFQALARSRDHELDPVISDPVGHGWPLEEGTFTPVMCEEPCLPTFFVELIKCSCIKK